MTKINCILIIFFFSKFAFGQNNSGKLRTGYWQTNAALDSIMVNDTLTLIHPKNLAQQDLRFLKNGDIEMWTWLTVCRRHKRGYITKKEFVWHSIGKFNSQQQLTITLQDKTNLSFKSILQTEDQHKYILTARQKPE